MAERKAAEDEFNPRHRIVGAVILVALAVIFLPMVLNDRPPAERLAGSRDMVATEPASSVPLPAPAKTAPAVAESGEPGGTRVITVPVEPRPAKPAAQPAPPAPAGESTQSPPMPPPVRPATATKPAVPDKPAPTAAPAPKGKWVVQMGVFSQPDNAKRLYDKLRKKGYSVSLDPPRAAKGQAVRVEVGPYRDEASAKAAAVRLQSDAGIKGVVRQD